MKGASTAALSRNRRYLVAVSGGRDSVSLLEWLLAEGFRKLVVCHLNHGLRGRESGGDAAFVRRLAKRHGLEYEIEKTDVAKLARERKLSLEAAGRVARHEFFDRVAGRRRCRRVLLGHHADDQAETVLINLFRGSARLSGMRPISEIEVGGRRLELTRPLLAVPREEIDFYLAERHVAYRDDASNESDGFLRNRVRAELVPGLREIFGRDIRKAVTRAAEVAGAESELLDDLVADFELGETLSVSKLRALHRALQRRVLHRWLCEQGVADVGFEEVERVRSMLSDDAVAKVNLPGDLHARRRAGSLFLEGTRSA